MTNLNYLIKHESGGIDPRKTYLRAGGDRELSSANDIYVRSLTIDI